MIVVDIRIVAVAIAVADVTFAFVEVAVRFTVSFELAFPCSFASATTVKRFVGNECSTKSSFADCNWHVFRRPR